MLEFDDHEGILDQAARLHDAALELLSHTMYDDFEQLKKLHSTLGMTVSILDALDTVGVISPEHLEWLRENSFNPCEDEYTVDGYLILDCITILVDDTVVYMVEAHDGTTLQYGRVEPGAYQREFGIPA